MCSEPRRRYQDLGRLEDRMLDLFYLGIGTGAFALLAGYTVALRRV